MAKTTTIEQNIVTPSGPDEMQSIRNPITAAQMMAELSRWQVAATESANSRNSGETPLSDNSLRAPWSNTKPMYASRVNAKCVILNAAFSEALVPTLCVRNQNARTL